MENRKYCNTNQISYSIGFRKSKEKLLKDIEIWLHDNMNNYIIDIEGETFVDEKLIKDLITHLDN